MCASMVHMDAAHMLYASGDVMEAGYVTDQLTVASRHMY